MRGNFVLSALTGLALGAGAFVPAQAQNTGAEAVPPVPGPYQAAPAARANPYANPAGGGQPVPYWMRRKPAPAGAQTAEPAQRNFIPGWVWSPTPPGAAGAAPAAPAQGRRMPPQGGAGGWPAYGGAPQTGYGVPPGYAPRPWPATPYGPPPLYGAPQRPNQ